MKHKRSRKNMGRSRIPWKKQQIDKRKQEIIKKHIDALDMVFSSYDLRKIFSVAFQIPPFILDRAAELWQQRGAMNGIYTKRLMTELHGGQK